jgi:hypothetical protein
MSLRDIGNSLEGVIQKFASDLDLAFSTSPLDWPIYLIVLALLLAFIGAPIFFALISVPIAGLVVAHNRYWAKHYDVDGNPTTRLSRAVKWTWEIGFYFGGFIFIWVISTFFLVFFLDAVVGAISSAIVSGVVILLAIRGRIETSRENRK